MSQLIFTTVHGSHLYGLAHEGSDRDIYYVYAGKGTKLRQSMSGDDDSVRGTLDAFYQRALSGSHQSVEALFSKEKVWYNSMYRPMLENLKITGSEVFDKYMRTIKKFSYGNFKRRRHACRLRLNLQELRDYGRFDPRLTDTQIKLCNAYANLLEGDDLWAALE